MKDPSFVLLEEGLFKFGFCDTSRDFPLLVKYIEEIELFNPAYGLVKVKDRRELIVKHILDSIAPVEILRGLLKEQSAKTNDPNSRPSVADVGSGPGLPGIPLAICMDTADFTLIERMGRRAGFLRNTLAVLGLPNITVAESEMEKIPPVSVTCGGFNMAVLRAFRPLEGVILKGLFRLLTKGGIIAAYKGRRASIDEEMANSKISTEKGSWEALPISVPFLDEERHLVVIRA